MSKRTSGLGKGLEDLLLDNAPELRSGGTVVRRDRDKEVVITPREQAPEEIIRSVATENTVISKENAESEVKKAENTDKPIVITSDTEKREATLIHGGSTGEKSEDYRNTRSLKALFRSYK